MMSIYIAPVPSKERWMMFAVLQLIQMIHQAVQPKKRPHTHERLDVGVSNAGACREEGVLRGRLDLALCIPNLEQNMGRTEGKGKGYIYRESDTKGWKEVSVQTLARQSGRNKLTTIWDVKERHDNNYCRVRL